MRLDLFDYALPDELIAQHPTPDRDGARLLAVGADLVEDRAVRDLPELLPEGALVVLNDTRVVPARLLGHKASGGRIEIFLVRREGAEGGEERWIALGKSSKPFVEGAELALGDTLVARVLARRDGGLLDVALRSRSQLSVSDAIARDGHVPLPPYIARGDLPDDRERYQTVFARVPGAVAAPTAGLHLSNELLERIAARSTTYAHVTLHVGLGTFKPVSVDDLDDHPMHAEDVEITESAARAIEGARAEGRPVVAVGTTVVRALESSAAANDGRVSAFRGPTSLLIQPGFRFRAVDRLLTNFHLPRSTLLALVCAFSGRSRVLAAYAHAVRQRYRFFSYGDAMLLSTRVPSSEAAR